MQQPLARLPSLTWEEMEVIFDELAATNEQRDQAIHLLSMTRLAARTLSPLDLMREIFCIALVLPCGNDRPPKKPNRERRPPLSSG